MTNPTRSHAWTARSIFGGSPQGAKAIGKNLPRQIPRNLLKSLDSDERIQGNPKQSNSPKAWLS
jgi:hypothetical protein